MSVVTSTGILEKQYVETLLANAVPLNGVKFLEVPLFMLNVNPYIQRLPRGHEKKIALNWDRSKCKAIIVSYRDGKLWIVDGQHRYLAAKSVGEKSIVCQVYEDLTVEQEALLFGSQDENIRRLTTSEKMDKLIKGRDEDALMLKALCDEYHVCIIPEGDKKPVLTGLRSAQISLKTRGEDCIRFLFELIEKAGWRYEKNAYGKVMITVCRNLYAECESPFYLLDKYADFISRYSYDTLSANARSAFPGRTTTTAIYSFIHQKIY